MYKLLFKYCVSEAETSQIQSKPKKQIEFDLKIIKNKGPEAKLSTAKDNV